MNRRKKIDLLNGIAAGTRTIREVMPMQVKHWHLKGSLYALADSDVVLSEQAFKEMEEQDVNTIHVVHVWSDVPIAGSEDEIIM